jgi:hypothetical protein
VFQIRGLALGRLLRQPLAQRFGSLRQLADYLLVGQPGLAGGGDQARQRRVEVVTRGVEVERRRDDVARLETRNAYLERELKLQERHNANTLKEVITLKQQLAKKKPKKRRSGG